MQFDPRGYLTPYERIPVQWDAFVETFVEGFPESTTRPEIWRNFLEYLEEVRRLKPKSLKVWIDGSFVTTKINPNDVDAVFFLDSETFRRTLPRFNHLKDGSWHRGKRVDAYFVEVFPEGTPEYERFTRSDLLTWWEIFSKSRRHRDGKQYPKGLVELQFEP